MQHLKLIFALWIALNGPSVYGVSVQPSLHSGLMQQPTSQYYHFVYGLSLELANEKESFLARGQYLQRPAFRYAGYVDQEFAAQAMFGTKIFSRSWQSIYAYGGGGKVWGYWKSEQSESREEVRYDVPGFVLSLDYAMEWANAEVRLAHQLFTGFRESAQTSAYVAWPYTFFLLSASYKI